MQLNLPMPRAAMRATTTYYKFLSPSPLEVTSALVSKIWRCWGDKKMDTGVKLGRDVMAAIGRELRVMHADIVAEGVPEKFAEILRRLDESSGEGAKRDKPPPL